MASAMPTSLPLLLNHSGTTTQFLISRTRSKILEKWTNNNACVDTRFSILTNYRYYSVYSSLQTCNSSRLPFPSLCSMFQSRFPHLRSPISLMAASQANSSPSAKTVRAVIKGRVQGVFYRNWTIENATQLGLKGWVRNRRDGSVEALFSGDSDKVQEMEQRCRRGPPDAMVTGIEVSPCDEDPGTGFHRKPTV